MSLLRNEILATCIKFGVLIFLKKVCLEHFVFCRNIIKTKFFPGLDCDRQNKCIWSKNRVEAFFSHA